MKKGFGIIATVLLCIVLVSIPVSLYGWEWTFPVHVPEGTIKGIIHLGDGQDWQFVGVKYEKDLWSSGHAAWATGPDQVTKIIHPDPNVNPAIKNWMRRNKVNWAITYFSEDGVITEFWVTRYNYSNLPDTDEYRNKADAYSTLYYNGAV
jgi:hypothetical protein